MFPARYAPVVFGFVLSAMISLLVSGVATFRAVGAIDGFMKLWATAWAPFWLFAFPVVLVVAPIARQIVGSMVRAPAA
jgi:hypothetical protein